MKNFNSFINENLDYPINKINIILDNMTMPIKFKIFDMTEEKGDIQLALLELSQRPEDFDKIWKEVESSLYFYHQESNVYTESTLDESYIYILSTDDWEGVYINGELIEEGHSIHFGNFIDKLIKDNVDFGKIPGKVNIYIDEDYFWDATDYHCPQTLKELQEISKKEGINIWEKM